MPIQVSLGALKDLSKAAAVPAYDPARLRAGILHFGVGNFHRAHQAVYLDDLFNLGLDLDWALVGAGVRPPDETMRQKLQSQDWLTTVVEQEADRSTARVTAPMIDYLKVGDAAAIIAKLADPAIRIASLTITEGGYYIDPATQR
ncbi:MAG: mannitol dehydrogenase family protein, partial [Devosia sp.]|nr:mannitol dehydrogenase family protein [Devosia sp.]